MPPADASPADSRSLALSTAQFFGDDVCELRFHLANPFDDATLYVKLSPESGWLDATPDEAALGPGEKQAVLIHADAPKAKAAVLAGGPPAGALVLTLQRLAMGETPEEALTERVQVRLPVAICPTCEKVLDADPSDGTNVPDVCPHCFERLRACPVCGTANTWLARVCLADEHHVVRAGLDWPTLGGSPAHDGARPEKATSLAKRWSYPSVPPSRREQALEWSAPVAAWGLVAAAAATTDGEAHVYAFDARTGAPLWEPYPLSDPVYSERGGVALGESGKLFVSTVQGIVTCLDALRGTRVWETALPGRVYGALTASAGVVLVPLGTAEKTGALAVLDSETGKLLHQIPLSGLPDVAPALANGLALVHDDGGGITGVELSTGTTRWKVETGAGFDAAPVVLGERVFSADASGTVVARNLSDGNELWRFTVTSAPFTGTPAATETLLHLPASDGLHLVSAATGRAVRRYGSLRPLRSAPVLSGGTVFYGSTDGNVYGIAPGKSPEKLYETGSVGSQILAAPALEGGALFCVATNGCLYALNLA